MARERIQGLWVGDRLSVMERLSIASFLRHGHDYHLFTYEDVEGLPDGAVREDARAILPESMIFSYRDYPSYSGFSNFFRYKLLLDHGGWWADTDLICLRPFDCDEPYRFASEGARDGREVATSCVLKAPAGCEPMAYAWDACLARDPKEVRWGETGPRLVAQMIARFGLDRDRQPARTFCPIPFHDWRGLIDPAASWHFDDSTWAVHLWNEMWRRDGLDRNQVFPPNCLYEQLKRTYLDSRRARVED